MRKRRLTAKQHRNIGKWCKALESGQYLQGRGSLRHESRYCCLGVACDVSGLGTWDADNYIIAANDLSSCLMPRAVAEHFGVHVTGDGIPVVIKKPLLEFNSLMAANDDELRPATFKQIAAAIRHWRRHSCTVVKSARSK